MAECVSAKAQKPPDEVPGKRSVVKDNTQEMEATDKAMNKPEKLIAEQQRGLEELVQNSIKLQEEYAKERLKHEGQIKQERLKHEEQIQQERLKHEEQIKQYQYHWQLSVDECNRLKATLQQCHEDYRKHTDKLNCSLQESEDECRSLALRLRKFADNNPNIAELSDAFRPTKLGEMFSELYDYEWTDSFEELHSNKKIMTEVDTTHYMLQLLKRVYDLCKEISTSYMTSVTKSITSVTVPMEVRRAKHGLSGTAHSVKEVCSISIEEDQLSVERKKQIANLMKLTRLELQDVVTQKLTETIMTEKNLNDTYPDTVTFIKSCIRLCWLMCLHKPPVTIGFIELKDDTPFEKDKYKEYTKTGKWLDFVVWPPLYLHEGGAMLCKGTAQGKKS